jgi:hypothetical protein
MINYLKNCLLNNINVQLSLHANINDNMNMNMNTNTIMNIDNTNEYLQQGEISIILDLLEM